MNELYTDAPECLIIGGKEYKINTDYRVWINFEKMLMKKPDVLFSDILSLVFSNDFPPSELQEETTDKILEFYRCGQPDNNSQSGSNSTPAFDYDYDAGYIYAGFRQQYGIIISKEKMHWWEFRSLFLAFADDVEFVKIVSIRTIKITSNMSTSEKSYYTKMKKLYSIPLSKEEQEKQNALEEALIRGESIDGLI